ncbi:MAG: 50S ribosomal protein L3 [bacterium]
MALGLIGKKLGMTQIFDSSGELVPITVIEAGPCSVVQKKTGETDGYNAVKIAFGNDFKEKNISKAHKGIFVKSSLPTKKHFKEFRVNNIGEVNVGQEFKADIFKPGDYVDVAGVSKGKGFTGVMKRHNFHGLGHSHGGGEYRRHAGSIGSSSFPSRVFKGMKMAGHMGCENVTIQKLEIVFIDVEKNIIMLKGSVPGAIESVVTITPTIKRLKSKKTKNVEQEQVEDLKKKKTKKAGK